MEQRAELEESVVGGEVVAVLVVEGVRLQTWPFLGRPHRPQL